MPLPIPRQPRTVLLTVPSVNAPHRSHHQRRYSSSKPPVPPSDGSKGGIDASAQTATKGVSSPSQKKDLEKREGRSNKKRSKDADLKSKQDSSLKLPSVPSTQHLHPNDIHVASFFSTYRPMSITTSVPPNSGSKAFSSIFSSKKRSNVRQSDVIYTLSSAVNAIEQNLPGQRPSGPSTATTEEMELRNAILGTQASASNAESDVTHLDAMPIHELQASIQEFAKRLRPFNPPPPPVPMDNSAAPESDRLQSTSAALEETEDLEATAPQPRERSYTAVLTIRESTHSDGTKSFNAHASPFVRVNKDIEAPSSSQQQIQIENRDEPVEISDPSGLLPEMIIQRLQRDRIRERRSRMYAISVKRQRKLKMKKHKHKKLLRRTRTLRRKLDKN
ncbi:hypothetical protein FQN57_003089 [Myotisia sp. PD_48]|nr:hypothetical protein FQN57_003089 [Myotisia sp. PD_48]